MIADLSFVVALMSLGMAVLLGVQVWRGRMHRAEIARLSGLLTGGPPINAPVRTDAIRLPEFLSNRLARAGWRPGRSELMACGGAFAILIAACWVFVGLLASILTGLTLGLLGMAMLEYRATVRIRQLSDCMLGFLERIRQLLTIGNSLAIALERTVHNSPPLVADCLAPALRRIANGGGVADSIEISACELGLYELHLLATAARTNLRFGGSLATTLKNMIETIRRRAAIERELRANTSQIRASAWVLALLPLLVASLVTLSNPTYSRWFLATEQGHRMLFYAALSQAMGVWSMRMIIRTRY